MHEQQRRNRPDPFYNRFSRQVTGNNQILEVEEERIVQAFWLRVLVELILQDVTHDLRIVCDQCVHPRVPAKTHVLGNRLPIADFKTPVVNTVEVRCKVLKT